MSEWAGSKVCFSFKKELLEAGHNFLMDTFKLALYGSEAVLNESTTAYTEQGELFPIEGYTTGGKEITVDAPVLVNGTALVPFETVVWQPASFTARGALCYNASRAGWPAVFVLDFGSDRQANGTNFAVQFPGADPNASILRLT